MSSKPFAALPATTALGATLLGLSATLFTVDVGGTLALDRERVASGDRTGTAIAASTAASNPVPPGGASGPRAHVTPHAASIALALQTPARFVNVQRAVVNHGRRQTSHEADVLLSPRPAFVQPLRPLHAARPVAVHVAESPVHSVEQTSGRTALRRTPLGPALDAPVAEAATSARVQPSAPEPSVQRVTLRDVRRFVMRDLKARDKHVCVISAMTYAAARRQVVVDLVFRDDKGRWFEKAVVRRGGTAMKLVGVKQRALPYRTVASTGIARTP